MKKTTRKALIAVVIGVVALAAIYSAMTAKGSKEQAEVHTSSAEENIKPPIAEHADVLVLGNVITMDENNPSAEAVAISEDKILYVGTAEGAKSFCDEQTVTYDYGANSVYPGFLEAHCHPGGAGFKMTGTARLSTENSLEECVQIMKEYMDANPDAEIYRGSGFMEKDMKPHASMLDAICPDKVMLVSSADGHSMWINTKAMETYGINQEAIDKWGTDCVRVDENGKPTGYISEGPVFHVREQAVISTEEMKKALLAWEKYALSSGYTAAYNAGVETLSKNEAAAYYELEKEGKLNLYTYVGRMVKDNTDTPEEDVEKIAREAKEHDSHHFKTLGIKVFADGVVEAHTAWLLDEYKDKPGYFGVPRFNDHEKMVRLLKAANNYGFNVHVHSIGDAATKAWVDAIAEAEEDTGNFDMRNCLAHLHIVRKEDIKRIADYNIMACTGMMWIEKEPGYFEQECAYVGEEKAYNAYPIKSFIDNGAVIVSHSDYPVSSTFSAPWTICFGVAGYLPSHGKEVVRHEDECISRNETLKALTINVAYTWHEEDRMGSLETGKLANLTVFDKDFMKDDLAEIENSKCLATFIDGKLLYKE